MQDDQKTKYRKKRKPGKIAVFYRLRPEMKTKICTHSNQLWGEIFDWIVYGYYRKPEDAQKAIAILNQKSEFFEFKMIKKQGKNDQKNQS